MLSLMGKRCAPGEVFIFFFAGHGTSVADLVGDELAVAITSSFDPGVDILLITDCCHSGTIGDLEKAIWRPFRAVSISACQDYQTSIDTGPGGALTALLLETL